MASVSQSEPALTTGTITALVGATISLAVAFGLHLSKEQIAALLGFVAVVGPLVTAFITRRQVTPSNEVAVQVTPTGELVAADAAVSIPNGTLVTVQEHPYAAA